MPPKASPFLMFNDRLADAVALYVSIFPDSRVITMPRSGADAPAVSAEFVVGGQRFMAYAAGPYFKFSQAFSIFIDCEDQAEVDLYWDALVAAGSTPARCGWITDPFGLSWQIVPRRFMQLIGDPDRKKAGAVMEAMATMEKLDVAALEAAHAAA